MLPPVAESWRRLPLQVRQVRWVRQVRCVALVRQVRGVAPVRQVRGVAQVRLARAAVAGAALGPGALQASPVPELRERARARQPAAAVRTASREAQTASAAQVQAAGAPAATLARSARLGGRFHLSAMTAPRRPAQWGRACARLRALSRRQRHPSLRFSLARRRWPRRTASTSPARRREFLKPQHGQSRSPGLPRHTPPQPGSFCPAGWRSPAPADSARWRPTTPQSSSQRPEPQEPQEPQGLRARSQTPQQR
jgi:hypothetical protein